MMGPHLSHETVDEADQPDELARRVSVLLWLPDGAHDGYEVVVAEEGVDGGA
jgi:hypothetical protein